MSDYKIANIFHQIILPVDKVLEVQAGDHFGFTWLNYGVVMYDLAPHGRYCEDNFNPNVGDKMTLLDNNGGNKQYSIRLTYSDECPIGDQDSCGGY